MQELERFLIHPAPHNGRFLTPQSAVTFETYRCMKKQSSKLLETLCKWHYVRIFVRFAQFMSRTERVEGLRQFLYSVKAVLISHCYVFYVTS